MSSFDLSLRTVLHRSLHARSVLIAATVVPIGDQSVVPDDLGLSVPDLYSRRVTFLTVR